MSSMPIGERRIWAHAASVITTRSAVVSTDAGVRPVSSEGSGPLPGESSD
jgi:hypothetical protein